ncbi:hypothetical protein A3K55_01635 [Candidatus Shapirobacteria bacterium RBG_13_44_7]|uniref:ribose-phosphate diphosphokinase n=1 Tax=Candidatus Shapirobacteria bacterium RBG_13_44_7 TaxID=1802149 RepID=A0A1F7SKW8_9BACT|nr:MAG: hypothetical protein A3K55_01635 [Candidatus Shapirobacteria bacterium RBG_13_44_7]
MVLISGRSNLELAEKIAKKLRTKVVEPVTSFADGEIRVTIPVTMRRQEVFIIQSTSAPVNNNLMELLLMVDAAKRASAEEVTAIIPYFGYSRQDRKDQPRVPISAALVAKLIKVAGTRRILTLDVHSEQQQGFFDGPWDNLYGSYTLIPAIKKMKIKNLVVASPDKGGVPRAVTYARLLDAEGIAIVYKERDTKLANHCESLGLIGDVKNKKILLVDDMADTTGTIVSAAKLLKSRGAKEIYVAVTHGPFSPPALERISSAPIKKWWVTDTILHPAEIKNHPRVKVVSVATLLAKAINRIYQRKSISDLIL